jgi:GNAT superfamily N-acetyltransferase
VVDFTVQRVPVERTFALRKAVLRPQLGDDVLPVLPGDFEPTTVAFGAVTEGGDVIAVARVTPQQPPFDDGDARGWRLRGMATDPPFRNQGVGTAVLQAALDYVAGTGGGVFWCSARLAATRLYARAGLDRWGDVFEEPDIGPHVIMWRRVGPS